MSVASERFDLQHSLTILWKGETLTNTMPFSVLLYDPHKGHRIRLKVTYVPVKMTDVLNKEEINKCCAMLNQRVQSTMDEQSIAFITHPPRSALQPVAKEQTVSDCLSLKKWARPGFEPGTSRTRSENHTPRPTSHFIQYTFCSRQQ